MNWQPIETAPKDGRHIIAFIADSAAPDYIGQLPKSFLNKYYPNVRTVSWHDEWYGDKRKPGWMPSNLDEEYGSYVHPSHWMPLPSPPAS